VQEWHLSFENVKLYSDECRINSIGVPNANWIDKDIAEKAFRKFLLHPQANTLEHQGNISRFRQANFNFGQGKNNSKFSGTQEKPKYSKKICRFVENNTECPYFANKRCRFRHPNGIQHQAKKPKQEDRKPKQEEKNSGPKKGKQNSFFPGERINIYRYKYIYIYIDR